jgi:type IV secretory pathway VirJ component
MGVNNPNLPSNVLSDEEAIQYLASVVNALRVGTYNQVATSNPTLTAAQMVGGVVELNAQTTAQTVTTDTAANIIARMVALDANAGVGSTAQFRLINDNTSSGAVTLAAGTNVTLVNPGTVAVAIGASRGYLIKILTATTVSVTSTG